MTTYISLLRGINVSGKNLISMKDLKEIFEQIGFKNIQTYIQSGNVLFQHKKEKTKSLEKKLQKALLEATGINVPFFIFEFPTFKAIYENNPYLNKKDYSNEGLYFLYLQETPEKTDLSPILNMKADHESFTQKGTTIYLSFPNGLGKSKLTNTLFEKTLKTNGTIRNRNTVLKLIEIAASLESATPIDSLRLKK
jgi:uncharacterized protein (DUF1697 family)